MNVSYGRDLDLNLLRVFVVVADTGSVTQAAAQLYLTQPAISAALRRLTNAIGAPLFARQGRGLALTNRGERLVGDLRPHLLALLDAALSPARFDPKTSERTMRLGLSDATEQWLLPPLLKLLHREAPRMQVIVMPVQFRTVANALTMRHVDVAVTVADDLPSSIKRQALFKGGFVCLFDPRHAKVKKTLTERAYFEREHVIVSYNGDLRGVVEDMMRKTRRVRCSVSSFNNVGSIVEGSALLATIPSLVADQILITRPRLRTAALPFAMPSTAMEMLWPSAVDDDDACRFVRAKIVHIAQEQTEVESKRRH
jgi:LysR family transcriptional activator of mexEF-oprN operon